MHFDLATPRRRRTGAIPVNVTPDAGRRPRTVIRTKGWFRCPAAPEAANGDTEREPSVGFNAERVRQSTAAQSSGRHAPRVLRLAARTAGKGAANASSSNVDGAIVGLQHAFVHHLAERRMREDG